jgi:hypothetical protein
MLANTFDGPLHPASDLSRLHFVAAIKQRRWISVRVQLKDFFDPEKT